MSDIIDLTEDSPEPVSKRPRQGNQADDQEARARIMAFAKRARQQQEQPAKQQGGPSGGGLQQQLLAQPPLDSEPNEGRAKQAAPPSSGEEQEARQRIMDFARNANAARGLKSPAAGPGVGAAAAGAAGAAAAGAALHTAPPQPAGSSPAEPAGGISNSLLAQLHMERMARRQQQQHAQQGQEPLQTAGGAGGAREAKPLQSRLADQHRAGGAGAAQHGGASQQHNERTGDVPAPAAAPAVASSGPGRLSVLSYNLWFREDVEVEARMQAVGGIIAENGHPDFLCFQEVTPLIYSLLQQSPWWAKYSGTGLPQGTPYFTLLMWRTDRVAVSKTASVPFNNSVMGRDLKCVSATAGGRSVLVATSHLESPTGWNQLYSRERVAQCKQAALLLEQVSKGGGIVFVGDMNWNPDDGQPPLPGGWCDAWVHLHTADPGLTYDPKANPMLNPKSRIRRRLDRAFCRLGQGWRLAGLEMVGREALPGLSFEGRPVLPSDHFGLLLRLETL